MKTIFLFILCFFISIKFVAAQIVINELDCDTPSIDDQEFLELKSDTPYFSLDDYVVVFFNGSAAGGNTSYFSIDLDGYTTDINGLLLIGSNGVSPTPQLLISANTIQNGADAVAVYEGDASDFPEETLATTDNLVDVLAYGTGDPDATSLMNLLDINEQIDENQNGNQTTESIQRANDDSYYAANPTPRQLNDGSGVILNGISISVDENQYDEGESFFITFTTEEPVEEDLNIQFSLANNSFDEDDFTGNTNVIISEGNTTTTTEITTVDDTIDEGDEVAVIHIEEDDLPEEYISLNNSVEIRIVDNDYEVADWGSPLNPTYTAVESTEPTGYYNSLNQLSGENLRQALQTIIADPNTVRAQTYADIIDILKEADQNPENSNQVWLVYTEQARAKLDFQTTSINAGKWNREHVYPRSRGGFYSIEEDEIADGSEVYWTTHADSLRHGNSDAHALRAVDGPENSSRGNQFYGESQYTGSAGSQGSFKGDVARSIFYMAIRYNDLEVVNGYPEVTGKFGDLENLLDWHRNDPPDDFEMNRNNVIYTWQRNRNPFIDQPDLVEYLWGEEQDEIWEQELNTITVHEEISVKMYPNPTSGKLYIEGLKNKEYTLEIFSIEGKKLLQQSYRENTSITPNLPSGTYFVKINSEEKSTTQQLLVY